MAKKTRLDFDAESSQESQDEPVAPQPASTKTGTVICQRCNVACEPFGLRGRGWVKCPKCGWKHKTFDRLAELRRAGIAQQARAAR